MPMKKGILDIKLMNWPCPRNSQAQNSSDSSRFDNRTKCLTTVDPNLLRTFISHQHGFIPFQSTIGPELMSKQPLTTNDISIIRSRNQDPCLIFNKGLILVSHSSGPFRVKEG